MRALRCIHALTDLGFLVRSAQNCKNVFGQFKDHNSGSRTWKLDKLSYFFHLLFPLYLFVTFIFLFENSQKFIFTCSPLWSVLVCKISQFGQKLPIRTAHHTFLESRHPETTKNPYYVLFPEGSQKKVSTHGL